MISVKEIECGICAAEPQFPKLQALYRKLPPTHCRCDQPGECCLFLPQMTWLEALQWFRYLLDLPQEQQERLLRQFVEFFLTNPVRRDRCPFLEQGQCSNYVYRPFACRAYGIWSQRWGSMCTRQSRESKQALLGMWQRYGIELPPEAVTHEIDYCQRVTLANHQGLSDAELMKILTEVYELDNTQSETRDHFEKEYQSDFSLLVASLLWGPLKAKLNKFAVIKEIVQKGTDNRLQRLLDKVHSPF